MEQIKINRQLFMESDGITLSNLQEKYSKDYLFVAILKSFNFPEVSVNFSLSDVYDELDEKDSDILTEIVNTPFKDIPKDINLPSTIYDVLLEKFLNMELWTSSDEDNVLAANGIYFRELHSAPCYDGSPIENTYAILNQDVLIVFTMFGTYSSWDSSEMDDLKQTKGKERIEHDYVPM